MPSAARSAPDLKAIQGKIVAKRFSEALADIAVYAEKSPDDPDALYMQAVCLRYTQQFEQSLGVLEQLKALSPENGRAHQEEGHNYRDMGRTDNALNAYTRAVRFNPALEASWRGQLEILTAQGLEQHAAQVRVQLDYLDQLPRPLIAVIDLISQGRLLKAEELCREFLKKVPHHVEAMRLLADIGARFGVLDDAELLLESAHKLVPDNTRVHIDLIHVLRKRQKFERALEEARLLLATAPDNPQFESLYAIECMQTGDYDTALEIFDKILARLPGDPVTLTSRGHALKTRGDYRDAVDAYHEAIAAAPLHGEAYHSLANLKIYSFEDDEIARMHDLERSTNLSHMDRVYLCFALGKAHEDKGEFDAAFRFYAEGNALKGQQNSYDAEQMSRDLRKQYDVCTEEFFSARADYGCPAPDPIFILGLPRAGSTLLEQILSSHSQVDGTLELPNILSLSQRLRRRGRDEQGDGYPEILERLDADEYRAFGEEFIEDTRIHRAGAAYFIDKMPNNFRHIGLIHLILPNARIIDARRHPMACCFSGYKQLFAEGQEFTYSLDEAGRYYRDYVELMHHWDEVLPAKVLRVQYENVVANLETEVRRILDFCGLEFETACVDFHRTERSVRTASSEQVRQPIFKSGLDYWKNFEPWLGLLKRALGEDIRQHFDIRQDTDS